MDLKKNQILTIIFTLLFFLLLIYYMDKKGILKYEHINKLLSSEPSNLELEYRKQLVETNKILLHMKTILQVSNEKIMNL